MTTVSFTTEIIGRKRRPLREEMFVTRRSTAQSPIIYEVLDLAGGLVAAKEQSVAEAEAVPEL